MSKKEIKISNEEMMELMGLKRTPASNDDSDKTAIELAIEKYSKEELAAKKTELPAESTTVRLLQRLRRNHQRLIILRNSHQLPPFNAG